MTKYIMKFGGTSLKDASAINKACNIALDFYKKYIPEQLIVVVSAQGKIDDTKSGDKVTNLLEIVCDKRKSSLSKRASIEEIIRRTKKYSEELGIVYPERVCSRISESSEKTSKDYSQTVAQGERISLSLLSQALDKARQTKEGLEELKVQALDYNEFGMITQGHKDAVVLDEATVEIEKALFGKKGIIVLPGFLGYNDKGEITTLGRDGSNYTATKVAEAVLADAVYIFSDEPGVRRAPPRLVPDAEVIKRLTYDEAIEYAELGAKIINAKCIPPARKENISIHIVDENYQGTVISNLVSLEHMGAKIIASSPGHSIMTARYDTDKPGVLAEIAGMFKEAEINIESIADERHALSIAFLESEKGDLGKLYNSLNKGYKFKIENGFSRISVIGEGMRNQSGLLEKVAASFARKGVSFEMVSQTLNQLNVTSFIPQEYERIAVKSLYDNLFRKG